MRLRSVLAIAALAVWSAPASALPVEVTFSWGTNPGALGSTTLYAADLGETVNTDGTVTYDGSASTGGWSLDWDVTVKEDPFIDGIFAVTNTSGSTQNYIINFLLPISPAITPSSLAGASVVGTLTDNNVGGATLGHVLGGAMYSTYLDGVLYDTLLPFDSSVTIGFGSGSTGSDSFGLPGLTQPGPAVLTSMGVQIAFTLTPGDSASFTSRFEVVPVPEPVTALMLGGGLVGLAVFGRKRG
jgi:hypothetical protein